MPLLNFILGYKKAEGFALISVLALVSLAALTATAFLASARLERQATRPLSETVQLEWALASGEKCAEQMIGDAFEPTGPNNFVTTLWRGTGPNDWTNETGYLLIGEPNSVNNVRWTYYAGFSTAGMTNFSTTVVQGAVIFTNTHQGRFLVECGNFMSTSGTNGFVTNPAANNTLCTTIELLGGQTSPPVGWVYITQRKRSTGSTNEVTSPVARVAWFLEDLSGKIDAERMGGLSSSRLTGTNPEEICLTNLIGTNGSSIITNLSVFTNTNNRKLFFTPGQLVNSSVSGLTNTNDLRYFATGLREFRPINTSNNNGFLAWIPCGIPVAIQGTPPSTNGYTNGGRSKLNLNQLLSSPNIPTNIASVISNNLPNFASVRAGGFTNSTGGGAVNAAAYTRDAYYLTLAANIVDYADNDSNPTTDGTTLSTNRVRPIYRGVDSYPFVNEYVTSFNMSATNIVASGIEVVVDTTDYVELWNPCNMLATGSLSFVAINRQPIIMTFSNKVTPPILTTNISFNFTSPTTVSIGSQGISSNKVSVSVPPNGFSVIAFPAVTNKFVWTTASPTNWVLVTNSLTNNIGGLNGSDTNSTYRVEWNNIYYDGALGGMVRAPKTISTINSPKWSGILPGFVGGNPPSTTTFNMTGDPRAIIYESKPWEANDYTANSSFGGRNNRNSISAGSAWKEAKPSLWADGGHDSVAGSPAGSINTTPTNVSSAPYTNSPPCRISNLGSYTNVMELGNIFDPIQWFDTGGKAATTGYGNDGGQWTNLTIATAVASNAYGGGTTLRVGRAEYGRFAFTNFAGNSTPWIPHMGASSAALLDLFCTTNGNTSGGPYRTGGKINLNTAPAPVLRALAGGISVTNDPAIGTLAIPKGMAEAFAQGVMRFRSQYPFLTTSHLCFIGTDAAWPNTGTWPANSVFGNRDSVSLSTVPGNTLTTTSIGATAWDDAIAEEWFSKIYELSSVSSENYRVYIVAQLVDTNKMPASPVIRKYVQFAGRPNTTTAGAINNTIYGGDMWSWNITKGLKKVYESPY